VSTNKEFDVKMYLYKLKRMLALRAAPVLALNLFLAGCSSFNYIALDAPIAQTKIYPLTPKPRIAIVLGSGGPRGYAHLGIIQVLQEAGIEPDLIVGSSVGALIGAFWANGLTASELETLAFSGGPLTLFDLSLFADRGWIRGQRLQDYVNTNLQGIPLEQLKKRVVVVASRYDDRSPVFFTQGNTGVAVRASSAVPNIISPVGIQSTEYVDADVSLPVAVSVARQAGAQFVIAVDVSARAGSAPPGTQASWLERDEKRRRLIDPEVAQADFLLHPDLGYMASPRQAYFVQSRKLGEAYAREEIPKLIVKLQTAGLMPVNK
jgi:NTE family protein